MELLQNFNGGLPWQSNGLDSALLLQGAWVRSLVRELRSHMPHGMGKKKQNSGTFDVKTCHVWYIDRAQNVAVIIITITEHRLIPGVAPRASTAHFSSSGEWWKEEESAKSICDNLYFFFPQMLEIN